MTKPRTPEEIAYDVWVAVHTPGNLSREVIFAALREAADAARREEREALRVWLAAESLPDCEACAKLDAATTAREALRPAAPDPTPSVRHAKSAADPECEWDDSTRVCTGCGDPWPCAASEQPDLPHDWSCAPDCECNARKS